MKKFDEFEKSIKLDENNAVFEDRSDWPSAYVDPSRQQDAGNTAFERVIDMLKELEDGKKTQKQLAVIHDGGEGSGFAGGTAAGEKSTGNYVRAFSYMVNKGFATVTKEGKNIYYSITPEGKKLLKEGPPAKTAKKENEYGADDISSAKTAIVLEMKNSKNMVDQVTWINSVAKKHKCEAYASGDKQIIVVGELAHQVMRDLLPNLKIK